MSDSRPTSKLAWQPEECELRLSETVQRILIEEVVNTEINSNANISAEERQRIVSSIVEDANKAASDIASYICSHKDEFGLNDDGTPRPDTPSSAGNCWQVVGDKIKAFFACKFIKESVVTSVAKLRKCMVCFSVEKPPLDKLIVAATEVVRTMTPVDCEQDDAGSKELVNVILDNIKPDHGSKVYNQEKVSTEVSSLLTRISNRFKQQKGTTDSADNSLTKIRSAVEHTEATDCGVIVTPVKLATPPVAAVSVVRDEDELCSDDEDEDDDAEEELPEAPVQITGSTRQAEPSEQTDLVYTVLISAVINMIVKNSTAGFKLSSNTVRSMTSALKGMLYAEMEGSESVKIKLKDVKKIAKAVYKSLCKYMGSKGYVAMNLMSQDPLIYSRIVQTIKRRLVKPKKTCVKRFFTSIGRIMCQPLHTWL